MDKDTQIVQKTQHEFSKATDPDQPRSFLNAPFIFALFIIMMSLAFIWFNNFSGTQQQQYMVKGGVQDLSAWNVTAEKNVDLIGEWEFYPGILLTHLPGEGGSTSVPEQRYRIKYVSVPGSWNAYLNENKTAEGSGTFRLVIKVPEDGIYGIKTSTIRTASRLFLNGQELANMGNPSLTKEDFIPQSKYNIGFSQSINRELELLVQVSNYEYGEGGILKPIKFGTFDSIMKDVNMERAMEVFIVSICLILAIVFIFIYFQRGREPYTVYFSLANLAMALYLSTMNNQVLDLLLDYDFFARTRIQIAAILGIAFFFLKFTGSFLKSYSNPKLIKGLQVFLISLLLLLFNNPLKTPSLKFELVQLVVVIAITITYTYIFWVLLKAIREKAGFSQYIIIIATAVLSYWLTICSKILFELELGYLPFFLVTLIMLGITLLISEQLHMEYIEATRLTEERLEKEFKYFYSQISPHFVFNTLNTIIALTYSDGEKTRRALNALAVYFRGKLELHTVKGLIPLKRELEMVKAYLEIEKMRYGDKLVTLYDIEDNLSGMIPPLTLQPLAENAVAHGIKPKEGCGMLKIIAQRDEPGKIAITIEDNGVGISLEKQKAILDDSFERIGLKNVINKIKLVEGSSFELTSSHEQGTRIKILIQEVDADESDYR